jgi:acetate kinase
MLRFAVSAVERGSANATEAFEMYCVSIQKYLAYYLAILGTVDALVFTGAIGAKSIKVRKALTRPLLFRKIHHIVTDASEEFMLAQHARPFLRLS